MESPAYDLANMSDIEGGVSTTVQRRADGSIRFTRYHRGIGAERAIGGDAERWLDIAADDVPKLTLMLLLEKLENRLDALPLMDEFCTRWRIPCRSGG